MSVDEYHLAEFPFGWKAEYWDGHARISPRHNGVFVKVSIVPRKIESIAEIKPLSAINFEDLCELFYSAFADSPEFCDYTKAEIKRTAEKNIRYFYDGKRGIPQPQLSRVAVLAKRKKPFVGACLITKYKYGYKNEILFVRSALQNKGIGTALVAAVLNDLCESGETNLWSEYQICNAQSAAWHKKFGFSDEPDIMVARLRRAYLRGEIWRQTQLRNLEKAKEFEPLLKEVEAEFDRLVEIEKNDFEAAYSRWRNDF